MTSASEQFFEMMREDQAVSDAPLIDVTLGYEIDGEPVTYTRRLTQAQLGELILQLDELADDNE